MNDYFIGIDLGGTSVKAGLVDRDGHVLGRIDEPTEVAKGPLAMVERVTARLQKLIDQAGLRHDAVKALGIGSPGPISMAHGRIIKAGNLPGFDDFAIRSEFSRRLRVPGVLDNDANAACWGEFWQGAGRNTMHMAMFTLGTGVGGGLVVAGEPVHGYNENAGELGHIIIQPDGRACTCGQHGCLEAYASATHTAARADERLAEYPDSALKALKDDQGRISCKDVFDCAAAGDTLANEVVDGTARALAQAFVSFRHITEPDVVVLAGGMIQAGDMLLERIQRFYNEMMWTLKPEPLHICYAELGVNAGLIGAAGLALHALKKDTLAAIGT